VANHLPGERNKNYAESTVAGAAHFGQIAGDQEKHVTMAITGKQLTADSAPLRDRVAELPDRAALGEAPDNVSGNPAAVDESLSAAEQRRYRILTESSFDIVCEIDTASLFRYLSPNYRDALGWNPEAMVGTNVVAIVHPEDQQAAQEQIERSFVTGWGKLSLRVQHNDGGWHWFE